MSQRLNQKLFEDTLAHNPDFSPTIGQVADEATAVETGQIQKFSQEGTGIKLRKYRIRICGVHNEGTPINDLPVAYGQSPTAGLRGESIGQPFYAAGTFVTVYKEPSSGLYYIDDIKPNSVGDLESTNLTLEQRCDARSGFVSGSPLFWVPQTHYKEGRLVAGAEWFNIPRPSEEDEKQNELNKDIVLPSKCKPVDTEGINKDLNDLINNVNQIRNNLTGTAGVGTTQDGTLTNAQNQINAARREVSKYSGIIANKTTELIQGLRRFILRKITAIINMLTGNAPLSTRYLINETTDKALSLISCLFVKILRNLEGMIADMLNEIITRVLNTGECILESFIGNFIGQLVGQLIAAINGILGRLSSLLGSVINLANEILGFITDILNFLKCDIKNICPVNDKWNFLEGGKPPNISLDFTAIFTAAQGVASAWEGVATIPDDIEDFDFTIDAAQAWGDALNNCDVGTNPCGPPNVVFWGGSGSQGGGNAVVNAVGDLIGVDIIYPGNYTVPPSVSFEDPCSDGRGGWGDVIMGPGIITDLSTGGFILPGIGTISDASSTVGLGVTNVVIRGGYNYLPYPDGSVGSAGRTFADRCQTIVRRANGDYDPPYSYTDVITLYYGDQIKRPAENWVTIDCDFTAAELPGCIEHGEKTCFNSMRGFDDGNRSLYNQPNIQSMVGFDDSRGQDSRNVSVDFHWKTGSQFINRFDIQGLFSRTGPEIAVGLGFKNDRRQMNEHIIREVQVGRIYDVHVSNVDGRSYTGVRLRTRGTSAGNDTWLQSEDHDDYDWTDSNVIVDRGRFFGIVGNRAKFMVDPPTNEPGVFGYYDDYPYAKSLGYSDSDIRYYLEGYYTQTLRKTVGPVMQTYLDDPSWGPLPKYLNSGITNLSGNFDYANDYHYAVSQGFTDQDIRYYLENFYPGTIAPDMQERLNDPLWGRAPEYYVTVSAPDCPPAPDTIDNTYPVIVGLDLVVVDDGGFGYADDDTATVLNCSGEPDQSAQVELVVQNGAIIAVNVTNPGVNFTCLPQIRINTLTGHNAKLAPVMKFTRVTDDDVPPGTEVIQVIDCVGRV